ncbi:O-antigen ligase family protein [Polaribacter sp.]
MFGASFSVFGFDRVKTNLVIIFFYVFILLARHKQFYLKNKMSALNKYIFIFIIFHVFNVLFSENIGNSLAITIVAIIGPTLFFYVLLGMPDTVFFNMQNLLKIIYGSVIIFIMIGLVMYNYTSQKTELITDALINRTGGGLWLSNISTQILAIFFPFAFSKVKFKYSNKIKLIVIILFLILLVFSLSRTGLIVYFIMLLLIIRKSKKKISFIILGFPFIISLISFAKYIYNFDLIEMFSNRFVKEGDTLETISKDTRFSIYEESFEIVKGNEFIGTGISTFNKLNINNFSNAHNIFINILVERGIIGVILIIILFYFIFKLKEINLENFSENNEFIKLTKIGILGFLLIGMTGNDLFVNSGFINGWSFYLILFVIGVNLKINNYIFIKHGIK